jgi:hypothetical protein
VEVAALDETRGLLEHRLPAVAGGADGKRRLVRHQRAGGEVRAERARRGVHPSEVGARLGIDEQRHHEHDRVGAGDGVGVVGRRAQATGGHELGQLLLQVRLARERLDARVDQLDGPGVDVDADDVVALRCELHGQRQPDLAQGDDGDLHSDALFLVCATGLSSPSPRTVSRRPVRPAT